MPCSCQNKGFIVTHSDGSTSSYRTESQAMADVARNGGAYKPAG